MEWLVDVAREEISLVNTQKLMYADVLRIVIWPVDIRKLVIISYKH